MPTVTSGRALAAALGVNEGSVRKALKRGAVPRESDGSFDLERCRAAWEANTDPARTKVRKRADQGAQSAPGGAQSAVRTPDEAKAAVALISAVLTAEGASAATIDFNAARTAEAIVRTYARKLALDLRRGELVEIEEVGKELEREFSIVRGRLLAIPGKLAAKLVGLPVSAIRLAIEDEISEALSELHAPAIEAAAATETKRNSRDR